MRDDNQLYYRLTLQELRQGVAENVAYTARLQAEMRTIEARLNQVEVTRKPCLFCSGEMLDLSPLMQIQVFVHGSPVTTLEHHRDGYGMRVPKSWECQSCGAFTTSPPQENAQVWTPEDIAPKSKALAALLFEHFAFVDVVAYEVTSYQRGWLLQTKDTWYYIPGNKERIIDVLGIG